MRDRFWSVVAIGLSLALGWSAALTLRAEMALAPVPFSNLPLSANASGALAATAVGNCGTLGPLTPGANVRVASNVAGALNICGTLTGTEVAFAALPASPVVGDLANINNSNTAVWGASAAGGGTDRVLVRWNGSAWTVVGK